MNVTDTAETNEFFEVVADTERSQAVTMVLSPGQSTGGPDNQHPDTDQWLYVTDGTGTAIVEARSVSSSRVRLFSSTLISIDRNTDSAGESHIGQPWMVC